MAATAKKAAPATRGAPAKAAPRKAAPAKPAPKKAAPAAKTPVKAAPKKSAATTPATKAPARPASTRTATKAPAKAPAAKAPVKAPAAKAPATKVPAKAPAAKAPAKTRAAKAPVKAPAAKVPVKTRAAKVPVKAPAAKAPVKAPAKAGPVKGAPAIAVREDESPWTRAELAEVRTELQLEIGRLNHQIAEAEEGIADLLRDSGDGAGDDQADAGTKTFEREHEMSLANNARELLLQNERALARLEDGTYGACERCGRPIGKMRLQAFPRVTLCVACKQLEERR